MFTFISVLAQFDIFFVSFPFYFIFPFHFFLLSGLERSKHIWVQKYDSIITISIGDRDWKKN